MASLTLDWLQLASLVGALQGLFLAGNLFARQNNRIANGGPESMTGLAADFIVG